MTTQKWNNENIRQLFESPLIELLYQAQTIHQENFDPNEIELCTLLSIKTGACPEDCAYCPQSAHYETSLTREKLFNLDEIMEEAKQAKENGALRFCMGAAWRNPPKKDFPKVLEMIRAVKKIGLETCVTLGMLDETQAKALKEAGLDFYNHNLDTSPEYYKKIITTRTYQDRLETLQHVREADLSVCCGGIIGMGETREDRIAFLLQLASLPKAPESIPINRLIPIAGTPLEKTEPIENFEFIRTIAMTRIMMPTSIIRLSAGRGEMSHEMQALCFMAGANSMWLGEKLLTTQNSEKNKDLTFLKQLGMKAKENHASLAP